MKLIKINTDHYVVVDETKEIQTNDKYLTSDNRIVNWHKEFEENIKENRPSPIICSTQPLEDGTTIHSIEHKRWILIKYIDLQEVKELIGMMEADKLAILFHNTYEKLAPAFGYETRIDTKVFDKNSANGKLMIAVCKEMYQALEDNKDKKYTESDLREAIEMAREEIWYAGHGGFVTQDIDKIIQSLQPKTSWEVYFDENGKIKL